MKTLSQRCTFTALMTVLATVFGTSFALYQLRGQTDLVSDVIKISAVLATSSVCASYVLWTATHLRKNSIMRGALAGLLTSFMLIPLPIFASTFKTEFLRLHNIEATGLFMSALGAIPPALITGLQTFEVVTKASIAAVMSSIILGIFIAKTIPDQAAQDTQGPYS